MEINFRYKYIGCYKQGFSFQNPIHRTNYIYTVKESKQAKMVRKETVLVAFMASLLLVASFAICAHATEGRPRMLASEKVYYPQGNLN